MTKFKVGDRVKMHAKNGREVHGEITIINGIMCKVLFDGDDDMNYDYYPEHFLQHTEKVEKK